MGEDSKRVNMICEQGDLGLWCDPISDHDKLVLEEATKNKKSTDDKKSDD